MGHPIGPKFGQYRQLIDMNGNSEQISEIFIFGRFLAHERSIFWSDPQKWTKIDLKSALNRPEIKISKICSLFPSISLHIN